MPNISRRAWTREIYKDKVTALPIHAKISERALEPGRSSICRLVKYFPVKRGEQFVRLW
jgi:hypothetical protein